ANSVITGCIATRNVNYGVQTADGCVVAATTSADNMLSGVMTGEGCAMRAVTARANHVAGTVGQFDDPFGGVVGGPANVITESAAYDNIGAGITMDNYSVVDRCSAYRNGRLDDFPPMAQRGFTRFEEYQNVAGISADDASVVHGSSAGENFGAGIVVDRHCAVLHCSATSNRPFAVGMERGSVFGLGFVLEFGSLGHHCAASRNSFDGFEAGSRVSLMSCNADSNGSIGFDVGSDCYVRNNTAARNGPIFASRGSGFIPGYDTGGDCRIEENHSALHAIGFDIGSGSFTLSNSAYQNSQTGYQINAPGIFNIETSAANLDPGESIER
ncbi:MAG: hypothetical protein VYC34_00565, partial [Planctomycetota bacterium]|nr:hypothetical protein [Planctomycetota bacterium]